MYIDVYVYMCVCVCVCVYIYKVVISLVSYFLWDLLWMNVQVVFLHSDITKEICIDQPMGFQNDGNIVNHIKLYIFLDVNDNALSTSLCDGDLFITREVMT